MPTLLQLDSSADPVHSHSRALTEAFASAWSAAGPDRRVIHRDLLRDPIPHLADAGLHWPPRLRPADAVVPADAERLQQTLIDELLSADVLVVGAPIYNYSMPSSLKAWIDHVHVPGVTSSFDVEVQPMAGRPAVIITNRGASYDPGSGREGWDHDVPALDLILGTALGMSVSVIATSVILAPNQALSASQRERADADFVAARERAVSLARDLN